MTTTTTAYAVSVGVADIRRHPDSTSELVTQALMNVAAIADEIAGEAALLGTDLAITSDADTAQLSVTVLSRNFAKSVALLADSTMHPTFPGAELSPANDAATSVFTVENVCWAAAGLTAAGVLLLLHDNNNSPKVAIGIRNLFVFMIGI